MRLFFGGLAHLLWFAFLTLLTQTGGLIWLLAALLHRLLGARYAFLFRRFFLFSLLYLLSTVTLVPAVARLFHRVPLPVFSNPHLQPENIWFSVLNRHYVRPELKKAVERVAQQMQQTYPGGVVWYLDAGFPWIDGYPLQPHFSHYDGKKVDLVFYWKSAAANLPVQGAPSPFGYGVFARALPGEYDYAKECMEKGYWYISLDGTLAAPFFKEKDYVFDAERTGHLAKLLAADPAIGKILIQPHLEKRLGIGHLDKFRQQGCRAARHDDHFHVQLK